MRLLGGRAASLAGCLLLAACAASAPAATTVVSDQGPARLPLSTSLTAASGASFAVVDMGGLAARRTNYWELFARPAGQDDWQLATPGEIANNPGLVAAASAAPGHLLASFLSGTAAFASSPMVTTSNDGAGWAPGQPPAASLARVPDALAAGSDGSAVALTATQRVLLSAGPQAPWRRLTSLTRLAASAPGRACGLTVLTAVALSPAGSPLVAGSCRHGGGVGLFARTGRDWELAGPAEALPPGSSVLGLASSGRRTTMLVRTDGGLLAASAAEPTPAGQWTLSPLLRAGRTPVESVAIWPGGDAAAVLAGGRAAVFTAASGSWRLLTGLPARTATLAQAPSGQLQALAPEGRTLRVFTLDGPRWALVQVRRS